MQQIAYFGGEPEAYIPIGNVVWCERRGAVVTFYMPDAQTCKLVFNDVQSVKDAMRDIGKLWEKNTNG